MSDAPHWERFTPDEVRALSLAFDLLCDLTGIAHPSDALARRFADAIVTVAQSGDRDPSSLAGSALSMLRHLPAHAAAATAHG